MLRKVQGWIRGGKKNTSFSPTAGNKKKNKNGRPRSKTEGARLSIDSDEFRRNDVNAFDIILNENIPNGNGANNYGQNSVHSEQIKEPLAVGQDGPNHEPNGDVESASSLLDLVASEEKKTNNPGDLSADEMKTLELLDSVVKDFDMEMSEISGAGDANELQNGLSSEGEEDCSDIELDNSTIAAVENRIAPIDFDEVLGGANDGPNSQPQEENWEVEASQIRKSFRFVSKGMYLPSPNTERRKAPELPPTDYPHTDDEVEDGGERVLDGTNLQSKSQLVPQVTSFSSASNATTAPNDETEELGNGRRALTESLVRDNEAGHAEERDEPLKSDDLASCEVRKTPVSSVATKDESLGTREKRANSSPVPKRPKPRVTSFKSSSLPPTMTVKPVTEMVREFEDNHVGQAF